MARTGRPPRGKIIVTVESEDREFEYADMGVTFDSTEEEILEAVQPVVLEELGVNIGDGLYIVKKAENSRKTYILPKSPAGMVL